LIRVEVREEEEMGRGVEHGGLGGRKGKYRDGGCEGWNLTDCCSILIYNLKIEFVLECVVLYSALKREINTDHRIAL
jgi:hypothetical protein